MPTHCNFFQYVNKKVVRQDTKDSRHEIGMTQLNDANRVLTKVVEEQKRKILKL